MAKDMAKMMLRVASSQWLAASLIFAQVIFAQQLEADPAWYENNPDADTFTITTAEELAYLTLVSANVDFSGKTIKLGDNIELPETWSGIGSEETPFLGTFDGGGYVISGEFSAPLFACNSGIIKNLGMVSSSRIAEINNGTIINSYATGGEQAEGFYYNGQDNPIPMSDETKTQEFINSLNSMAHENKANFWLFSEDGYPVLSNEIARRVMFSREARYFAAGETVEYTAEIPENSRFAYWIIFPFGFDIRDMHGRTANLSFTMPSRDLAIRPIFSKVRTVGDKPVKEVDFIASANVESWECENSCQIEVEDGKITITATDNAIIKTDMSPNASKSDGIFIEAELSGKWRLCLDIPEPELGDCPFFVELDSESGSLLRSLLGEANLSSITKTFSLSDFKNELGQQISEEEKEKVSGMSFAKTAPEGEAATLSISGLSISMSMLAIHSITASNIAASREADVFAINAACNANITSKSSIEVDIDSDAEWEFISPPPNPNKYGDNKIEIRVTAESKSSDYTLVFNKPIPFDEIVKMRWNNTLTVINNPANRPPIGYGFREIEWYRDGSNIGAGQSYYAGNGKLLDENAVYRVQLKYDTDGSLRSCDGSITLKTQAASKELSESAGTYDVKGRQIISPAGNSVLIQKNKNGTEGKFP